MKRRQNRLHVTPRALRRASCAALADSLRAALAAARSAS